MQFKPATDSVAVRCGGGGVCALPRVFLRLLKTSAWSATALGTCYVCFFAHPMGLGQFWVSSGQVPSLCQMTPRPKMFPEHQ